MFGSGAMSKGRHLARQMRSTFLTLRDGGALIDEAIRIDPLNAHAMRKKLSLSHRPTEAFNRVMLLATLVACLPERCEALLIEQFSASRAQLLQDLFALAVALDRPGYFVEVGVGDGRTLSNTHLLEKSLGWSGLLLEPNRAFHDAIRAQRAAQLDARAVYSQSGGKLPFVAVTDERELSGLAGHIAGGGDRRAADTYDVETVTLTDALIQHGAPAEIDFVSIDTEGSELQVLEGLDLSKFSVRCFTIEHNYDEKRNAAIVGMLTKAGYRVVLDKVSRFDVWLVRDDVDIA